MNISICGLGVMGTNHLNVCRKLGFNVISTYDPKNNDNYFTYLESLQDVDGVVISNPTKYHLKTILDIKNINSSIKILCEKPIADSSKNPLIKDIIEYSDSILIGQVERFNPVYKKIIDIVDPKKIIQIKTIRVSNFPSREIIDCRKDIGIHDLDLCCNICSSYPSNIHILSNKLYSHENLIYAINSIQIINEISWNYPYKQRTLQILTEDGIYDCDLFQQKLSFTDCSNKKTIIPVEKIEPLRLEHIEFQNMCLDNKSSICTVENNLMLLKLMGY